MEKPTAQDFLNMDGQQLLAWAISQLEPDVDTSVGRGKLIVERPWIMESPRETYVLQPGWQKYLEMEVRNAIDEDVMLFPLDTMEELIWDRLSIYKV